jgi:serine/threonine protein kinase
MDMNTHGVATGTPAGAGPLPVSFDPTQTLMRTRALDPPARPGLLAGLDQFEILDTVGVGGMGIVLAARDPRRRRLVAIKLLRPELAGDARAVAQFLAEARHMVRLRHRHILPVLAVVDRPQGPYYVMPYLKEGSLAHRVRPGQPLAQAATLTIARQVAGALCYAHGRGLIHRDLKPGNVLLDAQGRAYLADFGLVRTVFNDPLADFQPGHYVGTAPYMSPAVAAGRVEDTRCDIYGFGTLLYEMLTGQPPYQGRSTEAILTQVRSRPPWPIRELNLHAGLGLVQIAEGAMARELRDRYAQMADVVADLGRLTRGKLPFGPHGRPAAGRRTSRGRISAFVGGMGVAMGLAWVGFHLGSVQPPPVAPHVPERVPAHPPVRWSVRSESFAASWEGVTQLSDGEPQARSSAHSRRLKVEGRQVEVLEFRHAPGTHLKWDWGDGSPTEPHGLPARHIYAKPGEYTIRITIIDRDGRETTETFPVIVTG